MVAWEADIGQLVVVWGPMVNHRLIALHTVPQEVTDSHRYSHPHLQFVLSRL